MCRFPLPDESHLHTVWTGTASCGQFSRVPRNKVCVLHSWTALIAPSGPQATAMVGPRMQHAYFVPRNTTKLTTRGGTSPDGVEMTLIRERKSTHRLGTRLGRMNSRTVMMERFQDAEFSWHCCPPKTVTIPRSVCVLYLLFTQPSLIRSFHSSDPCFSMSCPKGVGYARVYCTYNFRTPSKLSILSCCCCLLQPIYSRPSHIRPPLGKTRRNRGRMSEKNG